MAKTNLIITIVIEEDTAIAKQGTISVSRNHLGHLRAFMTTNASDTVYALEQALRELAELERKEPVKPARSKTKSTRPSLNDAPEDEEAEGTTEVGEDETPPAPEDQTASPAARSDSAELNYDLIRVIGADQSPAAYKHAALLAESLRSEKGWNNASPITFEKPVEAWTQLQAGTLSPQEVISLYTTAPASPVLTSAPATSEPLTAQSSLL